MIKTGTRLKSQVCDTEIIVIKTGDGLVDLCAGGAPMLEIGADGSSDAALDPNLSGGTVMGKRYVDETGIEVLVTKAGAGTLSIGDVPLSIKEAKPLPASD
jgi:hypothetical protein